MIGEYIDQTIEFLKSSPVYLCIALIFFFYIIGLFAPKSSKAKASHILVEKKETLDKILKEINNDFSKFQSMAGTMSTCPSGKNGGSLGWFSKGSMVPPFDKVVFDPNTKLKTVLGPVQTHFGWHLIYIEDRQGV